VSALLSVEAVRAGYGGREVLKGVSFDVAKGETFAVIGPNGAGKTTLFKVMTGEWPSRAGRVVFGGEDITALPAHRRVQRGMGRTFQVARVFLEFTVLENIVTAIESRMRYASGSTGPWYAFRPSPSVMDEAQSVLADIGLAEHHTVQAKFLSHGDKKRLEFAITLAQRPQLLMLDEPTAGMSRNERNGIVDLITRIRKQHQVTVVMTEHDMDVIFGLADRLTVMNYGEIIASGTLEEVRNNALVREVYLGKETNPA
jgi:branched-chain amino acid transport system ATP-binding protein